MRLHNRQIKAAFWNDPDLLQWPRDKRWLYEGLAQLADDSGCLEDSPFALKLQLFPSPLDADLTEERIARWIYELAEQNKVIPYRSGGKKCLFLANFHKHQALRSPAAPEVPLPPWINFKPSERSRRCGTYTVGDYQEYLTVTVQSGYSDQPEEEPELEPELEPEPEEEQEEEPESEPESEPEEELFVICDAASETPDPAAAAAIAHEFAEEFGRPLSPIEVSSLAGWQKDFSLELIKEALARAALKNKRNLAYIGGILANWRQAGISTVEAARQEKPRRSRQTGGKAGPATQEDPAAAKKKEFIKSLYL